MNGFKIFLLLVLVVWHMASTAFFGWNYLPQSGEEFVCDGLLIVGLLVVVWGR